VAVFLSGVHATIAGVLAALTIPIPSPGAPIRIRRSTGSNMRSIRGWPMRSCRCSASPMPASSLGGMGLAELLAPLPLGIAAGLFVGKQIGIFGSICRASHNARRVPAEDRFAAKPAGRRELAADLWRRCSPGSASR
jgi:NhaA family Na+:H+ antiporter